MEDIDPRVKAIRDNKLVGAGSCSVVDECMSDEEVIDELNEAEITDPEEAVKHFVEAEGLHLEMATNARWGEDDDPELQAVEDFEARRIQG